MIVEVESVVHDCRRTDQDGWAFDPKIQLWVCSRCRKPSALVLAAVTFGRIPPGP